LDATKIKIIDPYIRLPYQLRNFMEFVRLVSEKKEPLQEIELHLVTANSEDYIEGVKEKFDQITYSLESMGINFTYEFDEILNNTFQLYPNPVTNILTIESKKFQIIKVEFFNLFGKKVKEVHSDFETIKTDNLSNGMYLIKISSKKNMVMRKILKI